MPAPLSPTNVVVVYRQGDPDSLDAANLYQTFRGLDNSQIIAVPCSNLEVLPDYGTFYNEIEFPIKMALSSIGRVIYAIVLMPNVSGGFRDGNDVISSTSRLSRINSTYAKKTHNPLYDRQIFKRFDENDAAIELICTRIDSPNAAITNEWLSNIENADQKLFVSGNFYLDPFAGYGHGPQAGQYTNDIVFFEQSLLRQFGLPLIETTEIDPYIDSLISFIQNDSFFWGWGADRGSLGFFRNSAYLRMFFYNADFDGAFSIRNIDLTVWPLLSIRSGYIATAGSMSNPEINGFLRPFPFFNALFRGAFLGESFIFSQPFLDWTIACFGDPLSRVAFPNTFTQQSTIQVDVAYQEMMDYYARSIIRLFRKSNILLSVSDMILNGSDMTTQTDLAYPFFNLSNYFNMASWQNDYINTSKVMVDFAVARNRVTYSSFYPSFNDYLSKNNVRITDIFLDTLKNKSLADSISTINLRSQGSWQFDFILQHDNPNTFAFYQFEIDVASDSDFEDILFSKKSLDDNTGWFYEFDTNLFQTIPFNGVTSSYSGRRIRYVSQDSENLIRGNFYYFRVRQRDELVNFTQYVYSQDIIYA